MNPRTTRVVSLVLAMLAVAAAAPAQPMAFEDVVRNLQSADPKLRISAVRLLQEARYPEAAVPMAALVNDPVNDIQLETIAAELAIFTVDVPLDRERNMLSMFVGAAGPAVLAFERGPFATAGRTAPPELVDALLKAVDDDHKRVRSEAIYALGVVATPPLRPEAAERLTAALDHKDPTVRAGAARVIGRLKVASASDGLFKAINDSSAEVRYAAMRALGMLGDERAVKALTEQFTYYGKGEGAYSALEALARIAHPSSTELFKANVRNRDVWVQRAAIEGMGRRGDASEEDEFRRLVTDAESDMIRAATAYALQKLGKNYMPRVLDAAEWEGIGPQVQEYLLEFGPSVVDDAMLLRLREPDDRTRVYVVEVLGLMGNRRALQAITPLTKDKNPTVAAAAANAIERIKSRTGA
jgi:HEAT repeat protein